MGGFSVLDQLVRYGDCRLSRYGEADVLGARLGRWQIGHVYTDDPAFTVCQGAARIARGDGRVGLDQVDQRGFLPPSGNLGRDLTPRAADNARRDRRLQAGRAADRDRRLAYYRISVREGRGRKPVAAYLDDGDVCRRVRADDLPVLRRAVGEGELDAARALDDVVVGD